VSFREESVRFNEKIMKNILSLPTKVRQLAKVRGKHTAVTLKYWVNITTYSLLRLGMGLRYGNAQAIKRVKERNLQWTGFPFNLNNEVLKNPELGVWLEPKSISWAEGCVEENDMPREWFRINKDDVILEIGAHVGYYTVPLTQKVGRQGLVVAIEPSPSNFRQLLFHLGSNKVENCIPIRAACWKETTPIWLELSEFSEQHHVETQATSSSVQVYGVTVNGICDAIGLLRVDWIKLDVEGAECEVLEASSKVLERFQPTLLVEVHGTWDRLLPLLERLGYQAFDLRGDPNSHSRGHILAKPLS
jgi:FkbM family methyltransferase